MTKKRNRSRKGKKEWRKNISTDSLEEQIRLEARDDQHLFVIDKPFTKQVHPVTRTDRKLKYQNLTLYQDLYSVPKGSSKLDFEPVNTPEAVHIRKLAYQEKKKASKQSYRSSAKKSSDPQFFDIWGDEPEVAEPIIDKTRVLPTALTKPLPGQSYNPDSASHQELLKTALDSLTRKQDSALKTEEKAKRLLSKYREASEVVVKIHYSDSEDEDESLPDASTTTDPELEARMKELAKHYSMRLTRTQRNKIKRAKELRKKQKSRGARISLASIPVLVEGAHEYQQKVEENIKEREEKKIEKMSSTGRFGKHKFQDKDIDFQFAEEIPSHLRQLKGTSDFAVDLCKNFQKRNLVEPRKPFVLSKKRRDKYVEKRSAKDFALPVFST